MCRMLVAMAVAVAVAVELLAYSRCPICPRQERLGERSFFYVIRPVGTISRTLRSTRTELVSTTDHRLETEFATSCRTGMLHWYI